MGTHKHTVVRTFGRTHSQTNKQLKMRVLVCVALLVCAVLIQHADAFYGYRGYGSMGGYRGGYYDGYDAPDRGDMIMGAVYDDISSAGPPAAAPTETKPA